MMTNTRKVLLIISGSVLLIAVFFLRSELGINKSIFGSKRSGKAVMEINHEENVALNQPFEMTVDINTLGTEVNAVGIYIKYDAKKLRLLDMDTKQSFCQFYPEKKFDNNLGTISLACGSPHPGIDGRSTMMKLSFLPVSVGSTTIRTTDESQILASDGKGTNVLAEFPQSTVNIASSF